MKRALLPLLVLALLACDPADPAQAQIDNRFKSPALTVYKAFYRTTLFASPVGPGASSETHLVAPGADVTYVLVAKDYDADAGAPKKLYAAKTKEPTTSNRADTSRIVVSEDALVGACIGSAQIDRAEYEAIADRYFPGDPVTAFNSCD